MTKDNRVPSERTKATLKRWYLHGDLTDVEDIYYCALCDYMAPLRHSMEVHSEEENVTKARQQISFYLGKEIPPFPPGFSRPPSAPNIFDDAIRSFERKVKEEKRTWSKFYKRMMEVAQGDTDDIITDLARDIRSDEAFPRSEHRKKAIANYLPDDPVIQAAFSEAWRETCVHRTSREPVSLKLRWEVLTRDNYFCQICGASGKGANLEIDHRISVADGGSNDLDNLWALCFRCNRGKGRISILPDRTGADEETLD